MGLSPMASRTAPVQPTPAEEFDPERDPRMESCDAASESEGFASQESRVTMRNEAGRACSLG